MVDSQFDEIKAILERLSATISFKKRNDVASYVSLFVSLEQELRKTRNAIFPKGYFHDPMWEILFDLFCASRAGQVYAVTDLGFEAQIPLATLLRYIARLEADGFAVRKVDPNDKRRSFVELTLAGKALLQDVFDGTGKSLAEQVDMLSTQPVVDDWHSAAPGAFRTLAA